MKNDKKKILTHIGVLRGAINRIKTILENLWVGIESGVIQRDPHIILFGAWMGSKFADNSRFLFQYLSKNKDVLGLKRVIWVTRNPKVVTMLRDMGYESYLCGTKESRYWHLKSGVHIICNATNRQGHEADIDIQYSWGAKKIQLWHGVGMKSVGAIANEQVSRGNAGRLWKRIKSNRFLNMLMSEGGWGEAFFLTTSPVKLKICQAIAACSEESMFISNYPRNCRCIELLSSEVSVIEEIEKYDGAVFYLPTFRKDYSSYVHPLTDDSVRQFLTEKNYLWIEKPHSASTYRFKVDSLKNVLYLDSDFDVNVLYPFVSTVISDYSSAVFDAVYRNIPVIMYTPDLENFKNGNIGLTFDIETNCKVVIARNIKVLIEMLYKIEQRIYFQQNGIEEFYKHYRREFWNNATASYDAIWNDIKNKAGID